MKVEYDFPFQALYKVRDFWLVVNSSEKSFINIEEIFRVEQIDSFEYLWKAENKIRNLEEILKGNNPILYGRPTLILNIDKDYQFASVEVITFDYF